MGLLLVFLEQLFQFLFRHMSRLHEEISDPIVPHFVDVHDRLGGLSLGAENGVFQRKMGFLEELDVRAYEDNMMAQEKIEKHSHNSPDDCLFDSSVHRLLDALCSATPIPCIPAKGKRRIMNNAVRISDKR